MALLGGRYWVSLSRVHSHGFERHLVDAIQTRFGNGFMAVLRHGGLRELFTALHAPSTAGRHRPGHNTCGTSGQ